MQRLIVVTDWIFWSCMSLAHGHEKVTSLGVMIPSTYLAMSLLVRSRRVSVFNKVICSGRVLILLSRSSRREMAVRQASCSVSNCSIWLFPTYKSYTQRHAQNLITSGYNIWKTFYYIDARFDRNYMYKVTLLDINHNAYSWPYMLYFLKCQNPFSACCRLWDDSTTRLLYLFN